MRVAVLGTGGVGTALAERLEGLGHQVTIGTRDVAATLERTEPGAMGGAPFAAWAAEHPAVLVASFAEAVGQAEVVINATSGAVTLDAIRAAGAEGLEGKVLVDISNPLDFSAGFPPSLFISNTDSLGERIQAEFPGTKVVKTLNTLTAALMVHPQALADGVHSVFVSGNDAHAKATVTQLLREFGHTDIIDLGDITTARGTEMFLPLWLRLMGVVGTPTFNIKVVR